MLFTLPRYATASLFVFALSIPQFSVSPGPTRAGDGVFRAVLHAQEMDSTPAPNARVLIVLSAADHVMLADGTRNPSGYFLSELSEPLQYLLQAGYVAEIASPGGVAPTMDEAGLRLSYFGWSPAKRRRALALAASREDLKTPLALEEISDAELEAYSAIYIPGGQAPMTDLAANADLGRILRHFHEQAKPTGAVCHGPVALLSSRLGVPERTPWSYAGYRMTSVTKSADKFAEWFGSVDGELPYYVNEALEAAGGILEHTFLPAGSLVVEDRELLTGQDPFSADLFGRRFVEKIQAYLIEITRP